MNARYWKWNNEFEGGRQSERVARRWRLADGPQRSNVVVSVDIIIASQWVCRLPCGELICLAINYLLPPPPSVTHRYKNSNHFRSWNKWNCRSFVLNEDFGLAYVTDEFDRVLPSITNAEMFLNFFFFLIFNCRFEWVIFFVELCMSKPKCTNVFINATNWMQTFLLVESYFHECSNNEMN